MIQFPETAATEWKTVAIAAEASVSLRRRIEHATMVEREVEKMRQRHEASIIFQQELDADSTPTLEMVTLANYKTNPAAGPVDLIDGVVKQNGLTLMLGASGSGKSTLALQMLHSLMTGDDFLGQATKTIMGGIGVLSYDMDASLMLDWMSGFPNIDPAKVSVVNAHKHGNPLGVPEFRSKIAATWKQMNTEVVMIDSFSASFFGHDQNDAAATQAHYRDLTKFALTECAAKAVIVIVHSTPGSPNKARGSTVHHDVADSIVGVEVDEKTQKRTVRMVKYRAALGQKQMAPVIIGAPDSVTHLVSLDTGEMSLKGMTLPPAFAAMAFPETINEPEPSTQTGEEDDDL